MSERPAVTGVELSDREQWQLRHGRPVPARITWALDLRGLEGPEVDEKVGTFEGNPDGDVDDWEAARATPRPEQVLLLAELTRFPVAWFYAPVQPGETGGGIWIKWRNRRAGSRCEYVPPDVIDERGVLLRAGQEPAEQTNVQLGLFPAAATRDDPERPPLRDAPGFTRGRSGNPAPRRKPRPPQPAASTMPAHLRGPLLAKLAAEREVRDRPG